MPTVHASSPSAPLAHRSRAARALSQVSISEVHRLSAMVVGSFGVLHLLNHFAIPFGPDAHTQVMLLIRPLYRSALTEPVLLLSVALQTASGLRLLWTRRKTRRPGATWQRWTGAYLSFFLIVHTAAALVQRQVLDLDTNFHWAAAVVLTRPLTYFFVPYYILGIVSFLVHLRYAVRRGATGWWLSAGLALGVLVVAGLGGLFFPIDLPPAYRL